MSGEHVVVVGGGLAGLSAAVACSDAGARVTLLERRPRFGGATWSFERNGLRFDNGQHVYLRCCTAYRRFLERLGTAELAPLQERLAIPVLAPRPDGAVRTAWIRRSPLPLPPPAQLAPSLLAYRHLGLRQRLGTVRAMLALRRLQLGAPALDEETFGAFLARHGQDERTVAALFDLIALPTTNVHSGEVSLALAAKVFKTGLLDQPDAADLGWARVRLAELHVDPAVALLEKAGASVRRRAHVTALDIGGQALDRAARARGVIIAGERLEADAVIVAVPHDAAAELVPVGGTIDADRLAGLGTSPIVDVHLVFDRPVSEHPVAAAVNSPVQFVFDRTAAAGLAEGAGQCLAVSISGADAEIGERPETLIDRYHQELGRLFPAARDAVLLDGVVSREHDATFRGVPGTAALRLPVRTDLANVFLAGAWTDTGWPATMEGAVRSGVVAASHALDVLGSPRAPLTEEVLA